MRSLGIDVGVRKGLDLVLLDETLVPLETMKRVMPEELGPFLDSLSPDVIAIDAPPAWGASDGSRLTERELRQFGIQCYGTPSDPRAAANAFYEWMTVGFGVFATAEAHGFPRYGSGKPSGTAMEVFPHASAVVLSGCLPPRTAKRREWRLGVLKAQGVEVGTLRSVDQIDAALAALTGLFALRRKSFAPGDPKEGVIVLPASSLPPPPYRRCDETPAPEDQPHLPGFSPCACGDPGCTELTRSEFARGHDARRKSMLWSQVRLGDDAARELKRRRWELPPEVR